MAAHPVLCVVRHGQTDWNAEGRLQGQQDIPINGRGRDQAAAVGRELLRVRPDVTGFRFVASPLGRTRETMEIMRLRLGLDAAGYAVDPRLMELTFGDWEGFTWSEVKARDPDGARARDADKWTFRPPRGESYADLTLRVRGWLDELAVPTLAVAHGGVARALLGILTGMAPAELTAKDIVQGRALIFEDGRADWI
jgi:broad specificity phosphatase PhoE